MRRVIDASRLPAQRWTTAVLITWIGCALVCVSGCGKNQPAEGHTTDAAEVVAGQEDWPDELRIGLIPVEGAADVVARFRPLIDHLSKELGREVVPKSATSYTGVILAMANHQLEFSYFGPKSYVEANRRANAEAVAMELNEAGEPGYFSILIARSGGDIKTLDDAKGKSFAFTNTNSTSGYLVPRMLFYRDLKVSPEEYFGDIHYSGSHQTSMLQVRNGDIAVAATNTIDLDRAIESGRIGPDDFIELWRSDMIPGSPMCVRGDLPQSLKDAYKEALLSFGKDADSRSGLDKIKIKGYVPTDDETYDVIRYQMMRQEKLAEEHASAAE
jgi:phosphonate transport system substrate-binding protein